MTFTGSWNLFNIKRVSQNDCRLVLVKVTEYLEQGNSCLIITVFIARDSGRQSPDACRVAVWITTPVRDK